MPNKLPYNPVKGVSLMYHPLFKTLEIGQMSWDTILIAVSRPSVLSLQNGLLTPDERIFSVYRTINGSSLLVVQYPHIKKVLYKEVYSKLEITRFFGQCPLAVDLYTQLGWGGGNCPSRVVDINEKNPRTQIQKHCSYLETLYAL